MERPYIVLHMVMSIDGKVTGDFLSSPSCAEAIETYYAIHRALCRDGFICGRVTMEESFTGGFYPDLSSYTPVEQKTDYTPSSYDVNGFCAVAFDSCGRLGWTAGKIEDEDEGYNRAQIVEVLSKKTDGRYLRYLQELGIPYVFAGEEAVDVKTALQKLAGLGIEHLLLEGGSILDGAFARAGVIDELSLVIAPMTAGFQSKSVFMDGITESYTLCESKVYEHGAIWLHYKKGDCV